MASIFYVSRQLGHASIQITVDTYGHRIPSSNRDIVNKLDSLDRNITVTGKKIGPTKSANPIKTSIQSNISVEPANVFEPLTC
jgi:hypothetical protein